MKQLMLNEEETEMVALALKNHLDKIRQVANMKSSFFSNEGLDEKEKVCLNLMKNFNYED